MPKKRIAKRHLTSRQVASSINLYATEAERIVNEPYDTDLIVRIPGIGLREVKRVRIDEDCFVVLDLAWSKDDMGKVVEEPKRARR